MKNFGIKSELELNFLRGKVKSVDLKLFNVKDGQKALQDHRYLEFDTQGNKIKLHSYNNGILIMVHETTYSNSGNKIGYTNYDKNGIVKSRGKFELDFQNNIKAKYHNGVLEEEFEYDEYGNIKLVHYLSTGSENYYEYDDKGLAIKQISISGEKSVFSSSFGGSAKKITIFQNDEFGNIIKMKVYDYDTQSLLFIQENKINQLGDEIENIGYSGDGTTVILIKKYQYEYDNNGNWISQTTINEKEEIINEINRIIEYYT